jgi:hypothetical protein
MKPMHVTNHMTITALRQGAKNSLICVVLLLLVWLAFAFIISLALKQSFAASFIPSFLAIWCLTFLAFLGSWIYGRCVRGRILLDCGPHPKRRLFFANFALIVFVGFSALAADGFNLAALAFASSLDAYWLIIAFGRLQVSEHGIWQYWGLLRWSKVGSYHWADDSTLLLTARGQISLFRGALPVAPEHRQAVDELLTQLCKVRPVA